MRDADFPIVLTADRSLMAAYPLLLDGMAAAGQTTLWSSRLLWPLMAPRVRHHGARARRAPLGLRRIEASLLDAGFSAADVAVVPPEHINRAIGPATRLVGLSSGDPLGLGMNSTTMNGIFGGRPITSDLFLRLLDKVRRRIAAAGAPARLVLGGPGAWQVADDPDACRRLGIDHVVCGSCESNIADVARRILDAAELPVVIQGQGPAAQAVPALRGPTVMGMVEVSRGCGWGCRFCTLAAQPMIHLPVETILADVRTNLDAGVTNISLTSEDIFRYGSAPGRPPQPGAVIALLERLNQRHGVRSMAVDHANVATVSQFTDAQLADVQRLLTLGRHDYRPWVNLGVETADGQLLAGSCGAAKIRPFGPADWGDRCRDEVRRLSRLGFLPMVSLVIGLPGETPEHVDRTLRWVDDLAGEPAAIVPVFLTPVRSDVGRVAAADLTGPQWTLFRRSMRSTFKWLPGLYWQWQRAAGVSLPRRLLHQILGRGYKLQWQILLRRRERAARK